MLLLLLLVAGVTNTLAQNVTIRGNNGSTIAAVKDGGTGDTFFATGGFATWQHQQLSMILTVSDGTALTQSGQLDNPANNMFVSSDKKIQIAKGQTGDATVCYATISLPKGYRFTGYSIKFSKPSSVTKNSIDGNNLPNSWYSYITFNGQGEQSTFGETNSNFSYTNYGTYTTRASITTGGTEKTIARTENNGDMGNVLYFKLQNPSDERALIQFESAEFFFTAEEDLAVIAADEDNQYTNRSAVDIPFKTSKVDYGEVANRPYKVGNKTYYRMSYLSQTVDDVSANFTLYEAESLDEDGEHFDGTTGKVVEYKTGSISSNGDYFKVGGVKDASGNNIEQVYFIESPTYIELSNGTKNPIGYRIINAQFDYRTAKPNFYITYTLDGTKYYLNTDGRFTTTPVEWQIDNDGYISSNGRYIVWSNNYVVTQTDKPDSGERFTIANNGRIYQTEYTRYYIKFYSQDGTNYGLITRDDLGDYAVAEQITSTNTLKIYDKEGKNPRSIPVTGIGSEPLTGLNNDAVKFGVIGNVEVKVTLTLQALNPYLDHMEVVCNDSENDEIRLSQDFTASDFSVSGGEFYFYVPEDTKKVHITFENLKSKYFDDTYAGYIEETAPHYSRINFVQSLHNQAFGTTTNNIYTNTSEAANAQLERLKVGVLGTRPFKFNNADEVGPNGGTLTEYPFTFAKYTAAPNNGGFADLNFDVTKNDQVATRYVFTTDETRYNIAPTDAVQHRAYAFYEMIIHVQSHTYVPKFKFTKVYDKTLYRDSENNVQRDAFYGVEVTAPVTEGSNEQGYASTKDIFAGINNILTKTHKDDFNNSIPTTVTAKHILYLDFSKLAGIYQITTDEHQSMDDYSNTNAANCMIFLPEGSSAPNNNVAYKLESGGFQAANDIVLTDMQPFYSPYDIQVHSANKATYTRRLTKDTYGKGQHFSIVMPYQLTVENGVHTNVDGSTFTVRSMQTSKALALKEGSTYAYMPSLANVSVTVPNMPYFIEVPSEMDESNLVITQTGALIKATQSIPAGTDGETPTPAVTYNSSNYTFTGPSSNGSVAAGTAAGSYKFTPTGTFAGIEVAKTQNIFYFGNNEFVNSADYNYNSTIKVAPFRMYYANGSGVNGAKLASFGIIFGEGEGDVTGISSLNSNPDLMVVPGNGIITMTSTKEQNVRVNSVNGVLVNNAKLQAGETQTINVPAGVYVINGVKIIVK